MAGRDIWEDAKFTRQIRFHVGLVMQYPEYQLFEETVYTDIAFGPKNMGLSKDEIDARVHRAAGFVGISEAELQKSPFDLSGGQMQRALLCRAVISDPKLLILDEPANFVDNRFENELYRMLAELHGRMAIVMISHDLGTITSVVRNIVCVNRYVHRHDSNIITEEQLRNYDCPIQLISHGKVPHTVLASHPHDCCPHTRTEE